MALTVGIVVSPESDHHQAFLFREDRLVHMPGCLQVREDDRTHYDGWFSVDKLEYAEWEKNGRLIDWVPAIEAVASCDHFGRFEPR